MRAGLHFAGVRRGDYPLYSCLVPVGLAVMAILFASASIDYWTVMRFFGSRGLTAPADAWKDHVFSHPLPFYLFDLPFYSEAAWFCVCAGDSLRPGVLDYGPGMAIVLNGFAMVDLLDGAEDTIDSGPRTSCCRAPAAPAFVRVIAVILLLGFAAWVYLGNYDLLFNSHAFMTGADFVDEKVTLPLRWLLIVAALAALPLAWMSKFKQAVVLVVSLFYPAVGCAGHRSRRLRAAE